MQLKYTDQALAHVILKQLLLEESNSMVVALADHFSAEKFKFFFQLFFAIKKIKEKGN